MKKDRNAFFESQVMSAQSGFPQGMNMNAVNAPYSMSSFANQGFYAGPMNNPSYNDQSSMAMNNYNDIEARISKLERQINRLDNRLSKLESSTFTNDETLNNNIYMV